MIGLDKTVKCYDTMSRQYVTVSVTEEVEQYIKRSYWREDMQERRFNQRRLELNENIDYYCMGCDEVAESVIMKMDIELLAEAVKKLEDRKRLALYYVYYKKLPLSRTAREIGVSSSYMSRLMRQIHGELKDIINSIDEI